MGSIGTRIREFRLRRDLTQERLAELLGVSAQAVSKWENGVNAPDISLLPGLSAALGVTLDTLFDTGEETHLRRIERMVEDAEALSEADFRYARERLLEGCEREAAKGRCLTLLAELYLGRAARFKSLAADCARRALELEPEKKDNHSALFEAMDGVRADWRAGNHGELIDYYRDFTARHPGYAPGYLWYMDALIADGRLGEAREALSRMAGVRESYHVLLYKGLIAEKAGDHARAAACWDEMAARFPERWEVWFSLGDCHARRAEYAEALENYRRGVERQKPPRFIDGYDSIAQICAIIGDREGASEACREVLAILREDWGLTEGETVRRYRERLRRLGG